MKMMPHELGSGHAQLLQEPSQDFIGIEVLLRQGPGRPRMPVGIVE